MTRTALSMGRSIHNVVEQLERLTQGRDDNETFTADVKYIRGVAAQLAFGTNLPPPVDVAALRAVAVRMRAGHWEFTGPGLISQWADEIDAAIGEEK